MDESDLSSFSPSYHAEGSQNHASTSAAPTRGTGLKLVLPPLQAVRAMKEAKNGKKRRGSASLGALEPEMKKEKIPRPVKLKPLREVLSKLIAQIKKKDDYAFFLQPVDLEQVPGYTDVVKTPMDLGTMTTKVERGKYRSLEEFADDLRLVTNNARAFNPPGSIYHHEANRIETWALEHIYKAGASVIEYEADWNIEIENDDAPAPPSAVDDDVNGMGVAGTPLDVDDPSRARSPSVASTQQQQAIGRRAKGKKIPGQLSETLEPDGGLPGAKDGLGAFPPGSDWAQLMLALKLKGKKYRTKKERMRMEKGGPPYTVEGSLDYSEMEDPFTILNVFAPDPLSRPALTPLYPTLPPTDPTQPPLPAPVTAPPTTTTPSLINSASIAQSSAHASTSKSAARSKQKRKHWTLVRNQGARSRMKEKEDEDAANAVPPWRTPREPHATDFGTFATLVGQLARQKCVRDVVTELGTEERLYDAIREEVERRDWSADREASPREAEAYVRDLVYGGVEGFAYVRSLARFVGRPLVVDDVGEPPTYDALRMPLAAWLERNFIEPLTDGRHGILRQAFHHLQHPTHPVDPSVHAQIERSLTLYPKIIEQLAHLRAVDAEQLDMSSLIREPSELFMAEESWAGADFKAARRREHEEAKERALAEASAKNAAEFLAFAIQSHREAEIGGGGAASVDVFESPEVLRHALEFGADALVELGRKARDGVKVEGSQEGVVQNGDAAVGASTNANAEDPMVRKVRLTLLALAKRAPLDKIAKLPSELVPSHLRNIVPTVDA